MSSASIPMSNWYKNLSPNMRYLTFRCGMSILGFVLFTLILQGSKNVSDASLYAGMFTAFAAILISFRYVQTDDRIMKYLSCVLLTELVLFLGLIFTLCTKFLYGTIENLEGPLTFEPISLNGWACLAGAAVITLATAPHNPTPENPKWRAQNIPLAFHSNMGLLILNTIVFASIMEIIL